MVFADLFGEQLPVGYLHVSQFLLLNFAVGGPHVTHLAKFFKNTAIPLKKTVFPVASTLVDTILGMTTFAAPSVSAVESHATVAQG